MPCSVPGPPGRSSNACPGAKRNGSGSIVPSRTLGPGRSASTASARSPSASASRTSPTARAWSSGVPWEKFTPEDRRPGPHEAANERRRVRRRAERADELRAGGQRGARRAHEAPPRRCEVARSGRAHRGRGHCRRSSSAGDGRAGGSESVVGTSRAQLELCALDPPLGDLVGRRRPGHLGEVDRPRTRHDPGPLVAAAAGRDPPSAGGLVRELVQHRRGRRGRRAVVRPRCASGSLACVSHPSWVTSTSGPKSRTIGGTAARNASSHPSSLVPGGSGRFTAEPGASGPPRSESPPVPGKKPISGAYSWIETVSTRGIVPEDRLRTVAVMHVDVDVGDPLHALGEHPRDRDRRIVVDAEPRGSAGHRVVQAARRVERVRDLARAARPRGRGDAGAGDDARRPRACDRRSGCRRARTRTGPTIPSTPWPASRVASMNSRVCTSIERVVVGRLGAEPDDVRLPGRSRTRRSDPRSAAPAAGRNGCRGPWS